MPPSIQPENIEMAMLLETGMIMLHAENGQDFFDMLLKAYIVAEQPDVHIPVGVFADGFFVTHTRDKVLLPSEEWMLEEYNSQSSPVPAFNMETPPIRITRDPLLNKSNFISYAANASWHQEILSASERARKHIRHYLNGLIEVYRPEAKLMLAASGTAVSQCKEAIRLLDNKGVRVGLIKIKAVRPFPEDEIKTATRNAEWIFIPEFNAGGWLAREVKAVLDHNSRVIAAPRVFGGMTMPPDIIVEEVLKKLKTAQ